MLSSEVDLSGKVILAVDDDADYRRRVAEILKLLNAETVFEADNAAEALAIFHEENLDIIITDYHMPRMDGKEMIQKIREYENKNHNPNKIIIVLWSSNRALISESSAIQFSRLYCLKSFLQKPKSVNEIIEIFKNI